MSKNAVIVTSINFDHVFEHTRHFFEEYCKRVNADFIVIDKSSINATGEGYTTKRFENLQVYKYFDTYQRIFLVDADVIIKPSCPNYFTLDPQNMYVTYIHRPGNSAALDSRIKQIQETLGYVEGWNSNTTYFNSGVMMLSNVTVT